MAKKQPQIPISAQMDELIDLLKGIGDEQKEVFAKIEDEMKELNDKEEQTRDKIIHLLTDNGLDSLETPNHLIEYKRKRSISLATVRKILPRTLQKRIIKVKESVTVDTAFKVLSDDEFKQVTELKGNPILYIKLPEHLKKKKRAKGKKDKYGVHTKVSD